MRSIKLSNKHVYNPTVCVGIMVAWSLTYPGKFTFFKFLGTNIYSRVIREFDSKDVDLSKVKMH